MRNLWLASIFMLALAPFSVRAADLLMGIAEGVAEQASFADMQEKYQPLADYLGRVLKAKVFDREHFFYRKVTIERPLRMRFPVAVAERLQAIAWWDWSRAELEERVDDFLDMDQFLEKYSP